MASFSMYRITQSGATFREFEAEWDLDLYSRPLQHRSLHLWSDYTVTDLEDGGGRYPVSRRFACAEACPMSGILFSPNYPGTSEHARSRGFI